MSWLISVKLGSFSFSDPPYSTRTLISARACFQVCDLDHPCEGQAVCDFGICRVPFVGCISHSDYEPGHQCIQGICAQCEPDCCSVHEGVRAAWTGAGVWTRDRCVGVYAAVSLRRGSSLGLVELSTLGCFDAQPLHPLGQRAVVEPPDGGATSAGAPSHQ